MNTGTGPENTQSRPRLSIRFRLVSLILACVVPLGIAACLLVYTVYQEKRQDISRHLLETTRTFSLLVDQEQNEIITALHVLATSPALNTADYAGFHAQARMVLAKYPDADIILADATGQQLVNSYLPLKSPLPKRRMTPRLIELFASRKQSVSGLFKGTVTGRNLVSVDVPVIRDGRVAYDLAMTLPVDNLIKVLDLPKLPPEWTATILDDSGVVVARTLDQEKFIGKQAAMPVLDNHKKLAPEGVFQAMSLAGFPVLAGYSQSAASGWTMVVSVPEAVVMRDLWRWLSWALGGTVLLGSLGVFIALRLGNKIATSVKTLSAQATAMGIGGTAQAGPIEFKEAGEVAQSLAKAKELLAQREDALRESKAEAERRATLLNATLDSIAEGLIVLGPDRSVVRLNSFASQAFPFLREGFVISDEKWPTYMSVTTEDGLPVMPKNIPGFRALAGETVTGEVLRFKYPGSLDSWAAVNAAPIRDADGSIQGAIVTFQDITERKRIREALRETQERYRTIVQTASEGIWVLDENGLTSYANATMAQMLGYQPEDIVGKPPNIFLFPEDQEDHEDRKREHRMGISSRYERRLRKKDGGEAWFIASTAPLVDAEGEYQGSFAMFTDITDRRRAEQFRIDVERIIRHDIKAPLSGLHSLAQYTFGENGLDEEMKAAVPGILHAVSHVIKLVDSSEKIIQMEHGTYEPKSAHFNLRDVMQDVVMSLQSLITARRVSLVQTGMLDITSGAAKPVLYGEEFLIEDMLINLVKNAIEGSPENRAVTISCDCSDREQYITIHNHGVVSEEVRERFFEKYSTAGKTHGKGLGTYSAQLIAKAHGGHIEFTSSVTDGTTVTVILPAPSSQS
ncbi:MAG: PAS domain S-box protein [Desulfovibrio sp.]|nr:PAS domain S-box protein [Desulfovibrio sp.]MBI4961229.1 PAS domain S-box protein [Desulfovibrio sp.]